jgi:hypothetical protein
MFSIFTANNIFSFYSINQIKTEVYANGDQEICINPDTDTLNEDQICESVITPSVQVLFCQAPVFNGSLLNQIVCLTVWQPPKIS